MLLTEEQAREKWCPEARCAIKGDEDAIFAYGINRWPKAHERLTGTCCIASDCMMWRWEGGIYPDEDKRGFCGLGGVGNIHR